MNSNDFRMNSNQLISMIFQWISIRPNMSLMHHSLYFHFWMSSLTTDHLTFFCWRDKNKTKYLSYVASKLSLNEFYLDW